MILGLGAILGFFGHGAWAAFENYEKFRELLSASLNNVFGANTAIEDGGISTAVRIIGWTDILIALIFVAFIVGVWKGYGTLSRLATSFGTFPRMVNRKRITLCPPSAVGPNIKVPCFEETASPR